MEINFTKQNGVWVAEFEATSDFNLHLERSTNGLIRLQQRGTETGEYVDFYLNAGNDAYANFDSDFGALVYPKWIKIISGTEVINRKVTFAQHE